MLEAKYYRDYGHNYMILQCGQQETVRSYQYKILTSGKIGEILRCSVRYINGTTYYYYDISSRTTLESLYRGKKMSYTQVKDVLCQLHGICQKLSGYFMEEKRLVLLPDHIYYDLTDKKYIGLYYPDYEAEGPDAYKPLMDFLLEHIDTEDRKLAENMYCICEMAEENYFFIEDALRILEDGDDPVWDAPQESFREENREPGMSKMEIFDTTEDFSVLEQHTEAPAKRNLFYPVFAVLSLLCIAGAIAVRSIYELTQKEEIVLYGSIAAMGVCLLFCLAGIFADSKKRPTAGRRPDAETGRESYQRVSEGPYRGSMEKSDADYGADIDLPSLDRVISRDMDLEMEMADAGPASVRSTQDDGRRFRAAGASMPQRNDNYGNTVFFDESKMEECKLYAVDRKNKQHIELKQFPCTVGKMAGCVDYVLSDDSISRIHARFDRQGEKVLLTDMNSTNGTYKNGLRMQPQETVEIEPGDEVRFGSLNYCYR